MKMMVYDLAVANDPSGFPSSPGSVIIPGQLAVSRTVTSNFTNQTDFFSYNNLNTASIALTVQTVVQDQNGQLITAWGRGVPMAGSNWIGYFEYAKRAGCPAFEVPPPSHEPTSTRTFGYWKTHAGFNGNNEDVVSSYLPLILGGMTVNNAATAVNVLTFNSFVGGASNGYNKLAAQLLAAKLNTSNGADTSTITVAIAASDAVLSSAGANPWLSLSESQKSYILTLMSVLDKYNNTEF